MQTEQKSPRRWVGVSYHKRIQKYRAAFRYRDRDLHLGYFRNPELAAWAVDFARYLLVGINPRSYHPKMGRPNLPPHVRDDYPRSAVLQRLVALNLLAPNQLAERIAQFDESCASSPACR